MQVGEPPVPSAAGPGSPAPPPEDGATEEVPEGTLVPRAADTPGRRYEVSRRWFVANSVLAVTVGGAVSCSPRTTTAATTSGSPVPLPAAGTHGHGVGTVLHRPPAGDDRALTQLTPFLDPLPIPPVLRPQPGVPLVVAMRTVQVRLHAQLPETTVWAYEGHFPGPTIEVRRGEPVQVVWRNQLSGRIPVVAVDLLDNPGEIAEYDLPGARGATPLADVAALPPWTSVHLHGALTGGANDGWPENAYGPGRGQFVEYENDQPAATLWYHDHAMHVTRLTTMAGLTAGFYLVRDAEEDALGLPSGEREIPLVLCDRNLDTDQAGDLTGQLLHKIVTYDDEPEKIPRSFTGPFTAVNGRFWPYLDAQPGRYRFRILNASSIRPYHLVLVADGEPVPEGTVTLIGTDSGLLPEPIPVPGELVLSPAERADVVVDLSGLAGRTLVWRDDCFIHAPNPDVLQIRVAAAAPEPAAALPAVLSPTFRWFDRESPQPVTERFVLLTPAFPAIAQMWEMEPTDAPTGELPIDGIVQIVDETGTLRTYRRVASRYREPVAFEAQANGWERWRYLSLEESGVPHPMHVHSFVFQAETRDHYDVTGWQTLFFPDGSIGGGTRRPIQWVRGGDLLETERGAKDVVRLGPGELVSVLGRMGPAAGRFLHHCHVYEHEDHKMMRPFTVLPAEIMAMDPHY